MSMPEQKTVVLLVDDQPFNGAVVRNLLAAEPDIELHYCDRALDAMAQANQVHPTIILQDLMLPDIDGLINNDTNLKSIPVVVVCSFQDDMLLQAVVDLIGEATA
jgi:PleD family two-component response regulator